MEDEVQKMVELKRAYADIILNTVKEAATRVMVSERKARCFQQDLSSVKDEALRMLLRLKNMIDSKMRETEMASLCQRRKVEELEAQLHEAEDVITDLRMQLKEARYQLEKAKKDKMQPLEGKIMNKVTFSSKSPLGLEPFNHSSSEPQTVSSSLKNMKIEQIAPDATNRCVPKSTEQSTVSQADIFYSHDSDVTSTVERTNKFELCRKRRSQRIRAPERNFLDYGLPIDVKDERRDKGERCLPMRAGKTDIGKNLHVAVLKRSLKLQTLRRMSRFRKCKTGSCRLQGKPHHPSCFISLCRPYLKDGDVRSNKNGYAPPSLMADSGNVTQNSSLLEEHKINSYKDVNGSSYGEELKGNKVGGNLNGHSPVQPIKPCDKSFILSPCRTSINLVNDSVKSGEDHSKNITKHQSKLKPLIRLDPGLTSIRSYVDSTAVSTSVAASVMVNRSRVIENAANSKGELMASSVKQESDEIRNLIYPSSGLNSEMNTNTKYEQLCEVTNHSPCEVDKKTLLKCTIQSKRKREAMDISDENISPEENDGKRRSGEKLKCEPEIDSSDFIRESTRESRQLSQVARQLISLSGKRW